MDDARFAALIGAATLGTARTAPPLDALWSEALADAAADAPERVLLRSAAARYLSRVAGGRSACGAAASIGVPPSAGRTVSEAAAWRLAGMLAGTHRELVGEWFELARQAGAALPSHWLPAVLESLTAAERSSFAAGLGPRAAWLASLNPNWASTSEETEPCEERWLTGSLDGRRRELLALRRHDPARARAWVERTWSEDPPVARQAFIGILLVGLGAEDEALLESALDDRAKGVRLAAADCLARLPGSAHARRMRERLEALVGFESGSGILGKLRGARLRIELPAALDKAAVRDGIEARPRAGAASGERAFWLEQMVGLVPPMLWSERFGCSASAFVDAALRTDHAAELLRGLTAAAARHPAAREWVTALCEVWMSSRAPQGADTATAALASLLENAPADGAALIPSLLRGLGVDRFDVVVALLDRLEWQWNDAATEAAFALLGEVVRRDRRQWAYPRPTLAAWGRRADATWAAPRLAELLERCTEDSPWRHAVEHVGELVSLRLQMRKEILP